MASKWMESLSPQDWEQMQPEEKEALVYTILGITKRELAQIVTEFEMESLEPPNAIFISYLTLAKMPVRIKRIILGSAALKGGQRKLQVIPMDAKEGQFVLSLQDPHKWGNLFYS